MGNSPIDQPKKSFGLMCQPTLSNWIFDCGAIDTMPYEPADLISTTPTPRSKIQTANGKYVKVTRAGTVDITPSMKLKSYLLIPSLTHKLMSVSQLTREYNCVVVLKSDGCIVHDALTGTVIGHVIERGGLYYVDETTQKAYALLTRGFSDRHLWMWHWRLGHPSLAYLKHLFLIYKDNVMSLNSETCVMAKSHIHSNLPSLTRSTSPFSLLHSDVWGPAPDFAIHNFSYCDLFVDDFTRMSWVYFLKHKSEFFSVFVTFYNMLCTQLHATP